MLEVPEGNTAIFKEREGERSDSIVYLKYSIKASQEAQLRFSETEDLIWLIIQSNNIYHDKLRGELLLLQLLLMVTVNKPPPEKFSHRYYVFPTKIQFSQLIEIFWIKKPRIHYFNLTNWCPKSFNLFPTEKNFPNITDMFIGALLPGIYGTDYPRADI